VPPCLLATPDRRAPQLLVCIASQNAGMQNVEGDHSLRFTTLLPARHRQVTGKGPWPFFDRLFCRMQDVSKSLAEQRVRSDDLASKHKGRRNKQERLATVMAGVSRCL